MENYDTLFDYDNRFFTTYHIDNKIRLGDNQDSGYVIADLDINYDCYISAGISDSNNFTKYFVEKYKTVNNFGFDGTINHIPNNISNMITFIKKNIGTDNTDTTTNLDDIFEKYNNIFLKMDIEGSEWPWILQCDKLDKISQLTIELHGLTNVTYHNNFNYDSFNCTRQDKLKCLEKLSKTHYIIHVHGNNHDLVAYNGLPNVMEITYVNKKLFDKELTKNINPLPDKYLDFPNNTNIDLNFPPFVNKIEPNPFLIDVPDKLEYTFEEYQDIQKKLDNMNVDNIVEKLYNNNFYELDDFKSRLNRGFRQKIINNELPERKIYKFGDDNNCIVCCVPYSTNNDNSRYLASQNIIESLKNVEYNGHLIIQYGGFPNPTGKEMKYIGVPYSFKIFMMLDAYKCGFNKIIWVDSGCFALNNPKYLFDILEKQPTITKRVKYGNNYNAMSFDKTIKLLNRLTKSNLHTAGYVETIVFGLNIDNILVKALIDEYYEMVNIGWTFFSIFPEEIVLTSLFNKPKYKSLLNDDEIKLYIHERYRDENDAKSLGFYFHHKKYNKQLMTNEYRLKFYLGNLSKNILNLAETNYKINENVSEDLFIFNRHSKINRDYHSDMIRFFSMTDDKYKDRNIMTLFGDESKMTPPIPIISKVRRIGLDDSNRVVLKIEHDRHWGMLKSISNIDIPYNKKNNKIIWRGTTTGYYGFGNNPREILVKKFQDNPNKNIDIKFNFLCQDYNNDKKEYILGNFMDYKEQLQSKFIISIEGNDVATGLKWQLLSNSVVFMQKPTISSWCMEYELIEWIHYIPLNNDFSDLEEKYKWAIDNENKCIEISKNATDYMMNFMNEENENLLIKQVLETYLDNVIIS